MYFGNITQRRSAFESQNETTQEGNDVVQVDYDGGLDKKDGNREGKKQTDLISLDNNSGRD